jgi:hypothetical protein
LQLDLKGKVEVQKLDMEEKKDIGITILDKIYNEKYE